MGELRARFAKFGLNLHEGKTRLIEFGRYAIERRAEHGEGKPDTFDFLGFTHRCVWTDRMLNAIIVGVRSGKWHALSDKVESELNLFMSARKVVKKKGGKGVGVRCLLPI